jgi:hypothetical protein
MDLSRKRYQPFWRYDICTQADLIEEQLETSFSQLSLSGQEAARHVHISIKKLIDHAHKAAGISSSRDPAWEAGQRPLLGRRLSTAGAYVHLHAASVMLVGLLSEFDIEVRTQDLLGRLQTLTPIGDQRLQQADKELQDGNRGRRRSALATALRLIYEVSEGQQLRLLRFRRALIVGTIILSLLAFAAVVIGWISPEAIPICFKSDNISQVCPSGNMPQRIDVMLIAFFGCLGAAIPSTLSIRRLNPTIESYGIPIWLAVLQLPLGAITSIVGILLISSQFIPNFPTIDNPSRILSYAIFFGFAQLVVSRFIDQRAIRLMNEPVVRLSAPIGTAWSIADRSRLASGPQEG